MRPPTDEAMQGSGLLLCCLNFGLAVTAVSESPRQWLSDVVFHVQVPVRLPVWSTESALASLSCMVNASSVR
jgi:hypothetical protein